MDKTPEKGCAYSRVLIALHKQEIYRDDRELWDELLAYTPAIREYYSKLYLDVHIDEEEGFAFLKSSDQQLAEEDGDHPRLMKRQPLTKHATLLAVVLREALHVFDHSQNEQSILVKTRAELKELMHPYYNVVLDDMKWVSTINSAIDAVAAIGFLKALKDDGSSEELQRFEVRRILKARLSAEQLQALKELLARDQMAIASAPEPGEE